jgi:hypothetical protein
MGEDLAASIEALAKRIAARAHELQKEKPLSFAASVRLEAFEGRLKPKEPVSAAQWSEYMLCLTTQSDKAWVRDQLQKMTALYNRTLSVFTAEKRALLFLGCHVKPSLVDAFIAMQLSNKQIPLDAQTLLSLPLLFPVALEPLCRIEKTELMHPGHQKDPVYFFFQDGAHTRSLCVVGAFGGILQAQKTEDGFDLCYTYPPSVPEEEQSLELSFYIDVNGAFSLQVNGKATTTFTEKDLSELYLENHIVQLSFAVDRGEGRLFGHLMKDDRPCQIGKEMRSGTDFRLALRTLQRSSDLMVSFKIRLIDRLA